MAETWALEPPDHEAWAPDPWATLALLLHRMPATCEMEQAGQGSARKQVL